MLLTAPFAAFNFEIFRSLLFSGFFLLPAWTTFWVTLASMGIGMVLALGVNEGAYMTEIVRAGLLSIDPGQQDASRALGMTYAQTMRRIVIPQALRVIIPPTGNEFISMLKTTSLLFTIAVPEIFAVGSGFYSSTFRYFEVLSVVSIWYLLLTSVLTWVQSRLEDRYGAGRMNLGRPREGMLARMFRFGAPRGAR